MVRRDLSRCRMVFGIFASVAIGARPAAFNTVRYSEKILESQGISIETVDLSEIMGRIGRLKDDDSAVAGQAGANQEIRFYPGGTGERTNQDGQTRCRD